MSTPTIPGQTTPPAEGTHPQPLGQQQPYQQPAFGQQPPPPVQKPKKPLLKRVWFWVLIVIAAIVVSSIASGGDDTGAPADTDTTTQAADEAETGTADAPEAETVAGIGDTVALDDWSIVVTGVGEPVASVGGAYGVEAQGVFVPVSITATNNGNEAQIFWADDFVLVDDQGREFSYSSDAAIWGSEEGAIMFDEINPGNTVEGAIFYDIPAGATIVSLEISGGLFTSPVTISLV